MNKLPVNPGNALLYLYRKTNCFIVLAGELLALQPLQPLHSRAGTVSFFRSSKLGRGLGSAVLPSSHVYGWYFKSTGKHAIQRSADQFCSDEQELNLKMVSQVE